MVVTMFSHQNDTDSHVRITSDEKNFVLVIILVLD